ncbi:UNVERIFIED_CONTAM: hypothetical protein K2H54_049575 [Gekko kuhli]
MRETREHLLLSPRAQRMRSGGRGAMSVLLPNMADFDTIYELEEEEEEEGAGEEAETVSWDGQRLCDQIALWRRAVYG